MLTWTGDFQVISGYQNLAFSLGRRLQTALTSLIYHPDFGSRIPPEVGTITDASIAGVLQAYTTSCLLSDPRVAKVVSVAVTMQASNTGFEITAVVLPNGLGASQVTVNQVFGPA
jgi:phage baseplate assembly protein W